MSLEKLKIDSVPSAFTDWASKHNALADVLAAIQGKSGVKVTVSEKNIIIESDPNANVYSSNELHYNDGEISIDIDGSGIWLRSLTGGQNVFISPLDEIFYITNGGTAYTQITAGIVSIGNVSTGKSIEINALDSGLAYNATFDGNGLKIWNTAGTRYAFIEPAAITQNVSLREINVCENVAGTWTSKKMLILGSATYT